MTARKQEKTWRWRWTWSCRPEESTATASGRSVDEARRTTRATAATRRAWRGCAGGGAYLLLRALVRRVWWKTRRAKVEATEAKTTKTMKKKTKRPRRGAGLGRPAADRFVGALLARLRTKKRTKTATGKRGVRTTVVARWWWWTGRACGSSSTTAVPACPTRPAAPAP
jgi:hypothetical protein